MFSQKEIDSIDIEYFRVIQLSGYVVTLQSKNTQHCWHIISQLYGSRSSCQIYHTHKEHTHYHFHGKASCLKNAVNLIKVHDDLQMYKTACKRRCYRET